MDVVLIHGTATTRSAAVAFELVVLERKLVVVSDLLSLLRHRRVTENKNRQD